VFEIIFHLGEGAQEKEIYALFFENCVCKYFFLTKFLLHEHFITKIRNTGGQFGSYMRNTTMEDSQGSYNHEEEVKELHVIIENSKTKSNGRRGKDKPITMRSLHV
jgi:hypothetical protein